MRDACKATQASTQSLTLGEQQALFNVASCNLLQRNQAPKPLPAGTPVPLREICDELLQNDPDCRPSASELTGRPVVTDSARTHGCADILDGPNNSFTDDSFMLLSDSESSDDCTQCDVRRISVRRYIVNRLQTVTMTPVSFHVLRSGFHMKSYCEVCRDESDGTVDCSFTPLKRRHHCRMCGRSVCSLHLGGRKNAPQLGDDKPHLLCETCFDLPQSYYGTRPRLKSDTKYGSREGRQTKVERAWASTLSAAKEGWMWTRWKDKGEAAGGLQVCSPQNASQEASAASLKALDRLPKKVRRLRLVVGKRGTCRAHTINVKQVRLGGVKDPFHNKRFQLVASRAAASRSMSVKSKAMIFLRCRWVARLAQTTVRSRTAWRYNLLRLMLQSH